MATKSGSSLYIPDEGDIVWVDFDPQAGHEYKKRRPAIVISPMLYNAGKRSLALVCPVTSTIANYPFEVLLPEGMQTTGVILADQIRSIDWKARKASFIETAPSDILLVVVARINELFPSPKTC